MLALSPSSQRHPSRFPRSHSDSLHLWHKYTHLVWRTITSVGSPSRLPIGSPAETPTIVAHHARFSHRDSLWPWDELSRNFLVGVAVPTFPSSSSSWRVVTKAMDEWLNPHENTHNRHLEQVIIASRARLYMCKAVTSVVLLTNSW